MSATKNVLVPIAPGFEEIEATTIIDLLRRAGVHVTTAAVQVSGMVMGAHGIGIKTDLDLDQVLDRNFDAIILPGGMPGSSNLAESAELKSLLLRHSQNSQAYTAAICAAPTVLAKHGLLEGRRATAYPSFQEKLSGARVESEDIVVEDGNVLTSQGPATAIPFALKMIEKLVGIEKSEEIRQAILAT